MQKVALSVDDALDAQFPGQRAARVVIECKDARRGEHLQATRKGDPDMPLDDRELEQKFLELTTPVLGDAAARAGCAVVGT